MTLLGVFEDDEYLPEYGTLVIRDRYAADGLPALAGTLLGELATSALSGTVATAGDGWLHGHAGDPHQTVRIEAHDSEPEPDTENWEDVAESPYHSRGGRVGLSSLTGDSRDDGLELGGRGTFRARVSRRAAPEGVAGDVWLIQFWPSPAGLPRLLKRTRPAPQPGNAGWQQVLGYPVFEVAYHLAGYGMPRAEGWLDEALREVPAGDVCTQLGVPVPETRQDAIPLLLATGVLEEDGGYRLGQPAIATSVVRLPSDLAERIEADAVRSRYIWLAADLTLLAAWADPADPATVAETLLIPEDEAGPLIDYAVSDNLIRRDGTALTPLPRPAPRSAPTPRAVRRGARSMFRIAAEAPALAPGPPPLGFVSGDGRVVVWRDGEPVTLARVGYRHLYHVFETTRGVYLCGSDSPDTLVHRDGRVEQLPPCLGIGPVRRSADGRFVAGVEMHVGRRSWNQVHLVDVSEGTVTSLPKEDGLQRQVLGVHDGAVYLTAGTQPVTMRWRPGQDPEALDVRLHQIDPVTGTVLAEDADGRHVRTPGGTRFPLGPQDWYDLAPGGGVLYRFRHLPPKALWRTPDSGEVREVALPDGCETATAVPTAPRWESTRTLLFTTTHGPHTRVIRWHVPDSSFTEFTLPADAGYRPLLLQPVL